jgi:hypothetical protein
MENNYKNPSLLFSPARGEMVLVKILLKNEFVFFFRLSLDGRGIRRG